MHAAAAQPASESEYLHHNPVAAAGACHPAPPFKHAEMVLEGTELKAGGGSRSWGTGALIPLINSSIVDMEIPIFHFS